MALNRLNERDDEPGSGHRKDRSWEGIGASLARKFARKGYHVGPFARSDDSLKSLAAEIKKQAGLALAAPVDLTDPRQVADGLGHVR